MSVLAILAVSPCLLMKAGSYCSTGVRLVACSSLDPKTRTFSCSTKKKKGKPRPSASSTNFKVSTFLPDIISTFCFLQGALIQKARAYTKKCEESQLMSQHHSFVQAWMQHIHYIIYPWKYLLSQYYVADTVDLPSSLDLWREQNSESETEDC